MTMSNAHEYFLGKFGKEALDITKDFKIPIKIDTSPTIVEPISLHSKDKLPEIECLCLTYGRFQLLREAVSFFILQDYPNKFLTIINDAPIPLNEHNLPPNIKVMNCSKRFKTLGDKRQFAIRNAQKEIVAHWDDDDTYLPWHLYSCMKRLDKNKNILLVKPEETLIRLEGGKYSLSKGNWEASYVFYAKKALEYGGYTSKDVGPETDMMKHFEKRCQIFFFSTWPYAQYILDRSKSYTRITQVNGEAFGKISKDYGNFEFIIPSENYENWAKNLVSSRWMDYLNWMEKEISKEQFKRIFERFRIKIKGI